MARAERITEPCLTASAQRSRPVALAREHVLAVVPAWTELLPDNGLRRGTTLTVAAGSPAGGVGSLALGLVAGASGAGSWCAAVTLPELGMVAAAEAGLDLERTVLVPDVAAHHWTVTVGALLDTLDVVVVGPPRHLRPGDARRLSTRARERGAVLVVVGPWVEGADLRLTVESLRWEGPDAGAGHLRRRRVVVSAVGRGAASRPRRVARWLPVEAGDDALRPRLGEGRFAGADVEAGRADGAMVGLIPDAVEAAADAS